MDIGLWVVVAVVVFVIGNVMGLKPKASEVRLGDMRLLARKLGLHPKLTPTPDWLKSASTSAMISCYTYIDDTWRLPHVQLIARDGNWQATADTPHPLAGQAITSPLAPHIKGLTLKANSISIFWQDEAYARTFSVKDEHALTTIEQELTTLRSYLITLATPSP